jgi:amino acid transporter
MLDAVLASVVTGFIFILGLLYACQGDIQRVLSGPSEQAVVNIFYISFAEGNMMPQVLSIALVLNVFLCGFSHMTVTTRITYALVRD